MGYGEQLITARGARSQEEVAEAIGVSRVTLGAWEGEHAVPTRKYWPAIEATLGVRITLDVTAPDAAHQAGESSSHYNPAMTQDERTLLRVFRHLPPEARDLLLKSAFHLYLNEQPDAGSDPLAGSGAANLVTGPNEPHPNKRIPAPRRHKNP